MAGMLRRRRPRPTVVPAALVLMAACGAAGAGDRVCDELRVASGQNLGAIPSPAAGQSCGNFSAAPREIQFSVATLRGHVLADLEVEITLQHDWAGDLIAHLVSPDATVEPLFGRIGATSAAHCGDGSDLAATYVFHDDAPGQLWQAAAAVGETTAVPGGDYYPTHVGGSAQLLRSSLRAAFAGRSSEAANGTWILELLDTGVGDVGAVSGATLSLCFLTVSVFEDGFEASHGTAAGTATQGAE